MLLMKEIFYIDLESQQATRLRMLKESQEIWVHLQQMVYGIHEFSFVQENQGSRTSQESL